MTRMETTAVGIRRRTGAALALLVLASALTLTACNSGSGGSGSSGPGGGDTAVPSDMASMASAAEGLVNSADANATADAGK